MAEEGGVEEQAVMVLEQAVVVLEQVVVVLVGEQGVVEQAVVALAGERGVVGIVTAGEQVDMTLTRQEVHTALMAGE